MARSLEPRSREDEGVSLRHAMTCGRSVAYNKGNRAYIAEEEEEEEEEGGGGAHTQKLWSTLHTEARRSVRAPNTKLCDTL